MMKSIFTMVSCTCLWLALWNPGRAQEQNAPPYLPTGPQPYQSLSSIDVGGKLTLKAPVANWQAKSIEDTAAKRVLTYYVATTTYVDRHYQLNQVQAYDYRGNPIGAKRLRELLQEAVPVLVSADGTPVDPLHLRLYKKDVIVLVAPVAAQQVPQIIPAQPAAGPPMPLELPDSAPAIEKKQAK